jgi:HD-like signal output (HDOD) protein
MELGTLELRISRSDNLPTLPQVALTVLKRADDPLVGPRELECIINADPAMAAKVLRVANSAAYGGGSVTSLGRAVAMLGMATIKTLLINLSFQQIISNAEAGFKFNILEYWRHSLATGLAARDIAKATKKPFSDELYGAGILHDIGMLAESRFCPAEFDSSVLVAQQEQMPLVDAEYQVMGYNHCDVGGLLGKRWGLTKLVLNSIVHHHNPAFDRETYESTQIIHVADALAHRIGFTNNVPGVDIEISATTLEEIGLSEEQLQEIGDRTVESVLKAQSAFGIA